MSEPKRANATIPVDGNLVVDVAVRNVEAARAQGYREGLRDGLKHAMNLDWELTENGAQAIPMASIDTAIAYVAFTGRLPGKD